MLYHLDWPKIMSNFQPQHLRIVDSANPGNDCRKSQWNSNHFYPIIWIIPMYSIQSFQWSDFPTLAFVWKSVFKGGFHIFPPGRDLLSAQASKKTTREAVSEPNYPWGRHSEHTPGAQSSQMWKIRDAKKYWHKMNRLHNAFESTWSTMSHVFTGF